MSDALRDAAQNALDVLDEARTYTASEAWSPSMTEECERAMRLLRAALAAPPVAPDMVLIPRWLVEAAIASLGSFVSDHGWAQQDMDNMDSLDAFLAQHAAPGAPDAQPKGAA